MFNMQTMEKIESKTIYNGEIPDDLLFEYLKRIYAGIPYGIKANLGGETQLTVKLFGVSIKENEQKKEYLSYETNSNLSLGDAFRIVYGGISNKREFGKVICDINNYAYPLITYYRVEETYEWVNDVVKPYLRPISSITDDEIYDAVAILIGGIPYRKENGLWCSVKHDPISCEDIEEDFDLERFANGCYGIKNMEFLVKHHFDYSGLIKKGMALKAENIIYGF